jgi:hypothetical protein
MRDDSLALAFTKWTVCKIPYEAETAAAALLLQIVLLLLLAVPKALRDRRSPRYQRGLIGESLREIGVILLHDVEHGVFGEPSMVLGKESVQVSELFVVHGHRASAAIPKHTATC